MGQSAFPIACFIKDVAEAKIGAIMWYLPIFKNKVELFILGDT